MEFLIELLAYLKTRKKLWMAPIIIVMVTFGGLLIFEDLLTRFLKLFKLKKGESYEKYG